MFVGEFADVGSAGCVVLLVSEGRLRLREAGYDETGNGEEKEWQ